MPKALEVYVVDDDAAICESLTFLLGAAGLESRVFECAEAFLSQADTLAMGCVLTDVRMPGMQGVDMVRRLRERGLQFPIIVMTGHGDVNLAAEAKEAGAFDFLEKPCSSVVLLAAVMRALDAANSAAASPQGSA